MGGGNGGGGWVTVASLLHLLGDLVGLLRRSGHLSLGDANALLPHELLRLVLMNVQPSACSSGLGLCTQSGSKMVSDL
jgi:hypothetical protein